MGSSDLESQVAICYFIVPNSTREKHMQWRKVSQTEQPAKSEDLLFLPLCKENTMYGLRPKS